MKSFTALILFKSKNLNSNQMIELTGGYVRNVFLGEFFISNMFIIMTIIFSALLILLILNYKEITKPFRKINKKTWLALLVIFIIGFALRNDSYFYGFGFDGMHYQETANFFFKTGLYVKGCTIGNVYDCKFYHQALFPAGFPYLIVLLYYIFGQNSLWAMMLSAFTGSLTIILVYLVTYSLFKKEEIGLYTSLVFALIPLEIMINGSAAVRPFSSFFIALTILFFLLALERNKVKLWSLFAITFSYCIYVRQENSILLIPMLLLFLTKNRLTKKSFEIEKISGFVKKYWLPIAIFIISQIPVQHWILFGAVDWNVNNPMFSLHYFSFTAPVIFTLLFTDYSWIEVFFNPMISVLLFAGIYFVFKGKEKINISFLWLWFLSFFFLVASYFQCQGYPQNFCIFNTVRYTTTLSLSYSIISGFVLFRINEKLKFNRYVFLTAIFVIIFVVSSISIPTTLFKDARLEEEYVGDAIRAVNRTDKDCLIFTGQYAIPNSDLLDENRRKWIDIELIMSGTIQLVWEEIENSTCMVFLKDYGCREIRDEQCGFVYKNFDLEFLFKEGSTEIYNLHLKER